MKSGSRLNLLSAVIFLGIGILLFLVLTNKQLASYMLHSSLQLDSNHSFFGIIIILITAILFLFRLHKKGLKNQWIELKKRLNLFISTVLVITAIGGLMMILQTGLIFYSLFNFGLLVAIGASIAFLTELIFVKETV
jgi:hypothetical protein